ncbi:MAG: OB-fold nucleic acid binding domain-containing protein [Saprospiraceae bacterium]|nr:OB-fold nucleic acid binding domain-containing protein [Saprospiraceae bacterium]
MFKDSSGFLELVWFQGASWLDKTLKVGEDYIIYGRGHIKAEKPKHPSKGTV